MSVNSRHVNAPPRDVFAVLADGKAYAQWVVGPSAVVEVDDSWPAVGASFVHQHGHGPLRVRDRTEVLEVKPDEHLRMAFSLRQLGMRGEVSIDLRPERGGTRVEMTEMVTGGMVGTVWNPVVDRVLWARNVQALQRLKDLVEERSGRPSSSPAAPPSHKKPIEVAVGTATALAFWAASNVRAARVFHPEGDVFTAELEVEGVDDVAADFLRRPGMFEARVRLSVAIGLPGNLPDIHGLAIKIPDRYGPGADQDLLLASSGRHVLSRRLPGFRWGRAGAWYSTILSYRAGDTRLLLGAQHLTSDPARFDLYAARAGSNWRRFAILRLQEKTGGPATFDPWNTGPDLVPGGRLNDLRAPAYQGSRAGRADARRPRRLGAGYESRCGPATRAGAAPDERRLNPR